MRKGPEKTTVVLSVNDVEGLACMYKIERTIRNLESQRAKVVNSITEDMFDLEDVEEIEICNNHIFVVKFKNINGTMPSSYFDDKAKQKLRNIGKIKGSALWKVLNNQN